MKKYIQLIKEKCLKKIDAKGLAIFRMAYIAVLFSEINQLYTYNEILYNSSPYVEHLDLNMGNFFGYWMIVLFFLFIGLFTRTATIINYLFSIIIFGEQQLFEYHVFYAYIGINFFLPFMPISRVLSIDSLIQKIKYSSIGKFYKPNEKVYAFYYLFPVLIGVGIVYFDSVLFKLMSSMWLKGLGMWHPANIPQATWTNLTFLMNNEYLVRGMGYLVILFETVFIFIIWFKRLRVPFLIVGVGLHIGILICFPIPWFALTAVVLYILMVPVSFWNKISFKSKNPTFTFYYDYECPLCIKTVAAIQHLDIFGAVQCHSVQAYYNTDEVIKTIPEENLLLEIYSVDRRNNKIYVGYDTYVQLLIKMKYTILIGYFMKLPLISNIGRKIYASVAQGRGVYRCTEDTCNIPVLNEPIKDDEPILISWLTKDWIARKFWKITIILLLCFQAFISLFSKLPHYALGKIPVYSKVIEPKLEETSRPFRKNLTRYLGLVGHAVFMDYHFKDYDHIFRVTYSENGKEITLPLLDEQGMPDRYAQGAFWINYTFRTSMPNFDVARYEKGIKRYILYWLNENGKDVLGNYDFKVYVKNIEIPTKWEKNFLNKQIAKPWAECGTININKGILTSTIDPTIK